METVPESCRCTNRMRSMKLSFELRSSVHVQIFAIKRAQRRVRNLLINSSPAEWGNCRLLRQVVLDFTVLCCSDQLVCFINFWVLMTGLPPASVLACLSQLGIERAIKRFPLLYHNFWRQCCPVADDIFVTLSMVLKLWWSYILNFTDFAIKTDLHLVTAPSSLQPGYWLSRNNCPNSTVAIKMYRLGGELNSVVC